MKNVPIMKPSALLNLPILVGLIPDPMKIGIDEEPMMIDSNGASNYLFNLTIIIVSKYDNCHIKRVT